MADSTKKKNVYTSLISQEEWSKIISKKLGIDEFETVETTIGPLSEDQLGFMGDHLKLIAVVNVHGDKKKQTLQFFAKSLPQLNKKFREYVENIRAFVKETGFFIGLLPDLNKYVIQDKTQCENGSTTSWTCDCYFARPDIVVLQDLTSVGFKQVEDRKALDYNHCVVTLEALAKFHASSIIFEENEPKSFQIIDKYRDILFETEWVDIEGHPGNMFLNASIKGMVTLVEHLPNYGKNYENYQHIQKKLPKILELMCEVVKPSDKFRNVICQGDLTINNLFYKYKEDTEAPIEAKIIDFQILRYNPPGSEVLWFLHLTTRRDFREKHLDEFLDIYYQSLSKELARHKLSAEKLLPWSEFKDSCDVYRNAARMASAMYFQQSMMAGDYTKKVFADPHHMSTFNTVDKSKYLVECFHEDPIFRDRNTESVEEFIEYCILKEWKFPPS